MNNIKKRIYFDNGANSPLDKDVLKYLKQQKRIQGNPSSLHYEGRAARVIIETARVLCANALGCLPEEIFFTSGASEANSWAYKIWNIVPDDNVHDSLRGKPTGKKEKIIAVSYKNNETGVYEFKKYQNNKIFIDLTSALGYNDISLHNFSNVVGASMSGHKIGALTGVGILYVKLSEQKNMKPLIIGHQENNMRGGTENVLGIASLGIAMDKLSKQQVINNSLYVNSLLKYLKRNIDGLGIKVVTTNEICLLTFNNLSAQTALMILDQNGISVSAGSACNSDNDLPSKILLNYGYTKNEALNTIRVSLHHSNTIRECKRFVKVLKKIIKEYDNP